MIPFLVNTKCTYRIFQDSYFICIFFSRNLLSVLLAISSCVFIQKAVFPLLMNSAVLQSSCNTVKQEQPCAVQQATYRNSEEGPVAAIYVLRQDAVSSCIRHQSSFQCQSHVVVERFLQRTLAVRYVSYALHPRNCWQQTQTVLTLNDDIPSASYNFHHPQIFITRCYFSSVAEGE